MKIELDSFDKKYHEHLLKEFGERLLLYNYKVNLPIHNIAIDPKYIAGILDLTHIKHKTKEIIIGDQLTIVVPINYAFIKIIGFGATSVDIPVGVPTNRGYKSKVVEFESFVVDSHLNFTSNSVEKMKQYICDFKVWASKRHTNLDYSWKEYFRESCEKYSGAYGLDDDTIDYALEGDPENYWNID